jgi:hypothetical protein
MNKNFLDGYLGRPSGFGTAEHLHGSIARDKLFNTNNTGWNPPKASPFGNGNQPKSGLFGTPKKTGSVAGFTAENDSLRRLQLAPEKLEKKPWWKR